MDACSLPPELRVAQTSRSYGFCSEWPWLGIAHNCVGASTFWLLCVATETSMPVARLNHNFARVFFRGSRVRPPRDTPCGEMHHRPLYKIDTETICLITDTMLQQVRDTNEKSPEWFAFVAYF